MKLHKKFPTYRDGTLWLHEHGYSSAGVRIWPDDSVTITLEGEHAMRATEEETNTKVSDRACRYLNLEEDA